MKSLLDKLYTRIDSMNPVSRKVVKYGFMFFLFIVFSCALLVIANKYFLNYNYQVAQKSLEVFRSSFSVLGITMIGGLLMDYISKKT